jgi:F-type H+-transporting ATPase subunit b
VDINATLFGQMGTFLVFIFVTMKFVWPPIMQAMRERQQRISDGLAAADRGKRELAEADSQVKELIREAREEAQKIVDMANRRSVEMVDEAKGQAREEGDRLVAAAKAEIEQEVARARQTLRAEVASLAVAGAGQILEREIDPASHAKMLDDLAAQV